MLRKIVLCGLIIIQGCVYADVQMPLDTDMNQTRLGSKSGRATSYSVLWLVAWGDSSTAKAAEKGAISVVNHLDQEVELALFGAFVKNTTIAYGD